MSGLKSFKLAFHSSKTNAATEDLIFNPKDLPHVKIGDILEIFHHGEDSCHLLQQVRSLRDASEFQVKDKDVISISKTIGNKFELRPPKEVIVCVINPQEVSIDLVEVVFKDQYYSRSDMWRLRVSLLNSCLLHGQKLEFAEMRCSVEEMWSKGVRVMCGAVTDVTRMTFRSSTSQVNIFIQMSREMWEFDDYGDLYFEKVVDGFLVDLFNLWKEKVCNHDVTITLFSRTFYEAKSLDEFPDDMRECVCKDYRGKFFEDFYRVIVQNERYDEWTKQLNNLKEIFNDYNDHVLHFHEGIEVKKDDESVMPSRWNPTSAKGISSASYRRGKRIPGGWNSTSAQGNVLEVLNMALNVFEKYFIDRCFDRTGKMSIVITPGVGIFDVDRELMNITKQRTIDCGSSVDLVCMGEQPLYAVPLFKFHNRNQPTCSDIGDDYNIPHWINQSFYTSKNQMETHDPTMVALNVKLLDSLRKERERNETQPTAETGNLAKPITWENCLNNNEVPFVNYDEHDAQVFQPPFHLNQGKISSTFTETNTFDIKQCRVPRVAHTRQTKGLFSDEDRNELTEKSIEFMSHSYGGTLTMEFEKPKYIGTASSPSGHQHGKNHSGKRRKHKALVNPFAPSRLNFKVTSNQRRWSHAFPNVRKSGSGVNIRQSISSSIHAAAGAFDLHFSSPPSSNVIHVSSPSRELLPSLAAVHSAFESRRFPRIHRSSECSESSERVSSLVGSCAFTNSIDSLREMENNNAYDTARNPFFQDSSSATLHALRHVDSMSSMTSVATAFEGSYSTSSLGRFRTTSLRNGRSSGFIRDVQRQSSATTESDGLGFFVNGGGGEQESFATFRNRASMDWKGMAIPASLPITTDYFPDQQTLETAYLVADYGLVEEMAMSFETDVIGRRPLTMRQVYDQMIYQRIAQGFQIVLTPKNSVVQRTFRKGPAQFIDQILLSIGRLFHKITLYDSKVVVMRFWPRHHHSQNTYHYTYRFQVPDSNTYDVSWTDFYTEKLELYNWNYIDHHLLTRGEEHNNLQDSHKYWRSRFFLLPSCNISTKQIIDGTADEGCNIYKERNAEKEMQLVDGFLRFLEVANKLKRLTPPKNIKNIKDGGGMLGRRGSIDLTSCGSLGTTDTTAAAKSVTEPLALHIVTAAGVLPLPPQGVTAAAADVKKSVQGVIGHEPVPQSSPSGLGLHSKTHESPHTVKNVTQQTTLTVNSSNAEIVQSMFDSLTLFKSQAEFPQLPTNSFISADAVFWSVRSIVGIDSVKNGTKLMQRLVDERLICRASGRFNSPFIFGFYFYFIVSDCSCPINYDVGFEREWCEVAVSMNVDDDESKTIEMFSENFDEISHEDAAFLTYSNAAETFDVYKMVHVDVDPANKSDRDEWALARYHRFYNPNCAFELTVEWLVATGCLLADLVLGWTRKAKDFGFHFLPVPCDPFALPFTPSSDPLRGPIFVPLDINCLTMEGEQELFSEYPFESRQSRLALFQDSIVRSFGFMRDVCHPPSSSSSSSRSGFKSPLQYVHCTGNMFVMILSTKSSSTEKDNVRRDNATSNNNNTKCNKTLQQQYEEYIIRQCNRQKNANAKTSSQHVGFLWAWNFMLTKRWRSANTGDEALQDRMMSDFRRFCSNSNGRLKAFWDQCKDSQKRQQQDLETEDAGGGGGGGSSSNRSQVSMGDETV